MGKDLTLILGGARSGKSACAERLAAGRGSRVLFVATAEALDAEMARRIQEHRSRRPSHWRTIEAPRDVGRAIQAAGGEPEVVVLDCLTLLASNALPALDEEIEGLLLAYRAGSAAWIVVSNEVGLGLVPPTPLGREYRDALGRANQRLAAAADRVLFMVAGIPLPLKG